MTFKLKDLEDELEFISSDFEYSVMDNECMLSSVSMSMSKHIFVTHIKDNLMDDDDLLGFQLGYTHNQPLTFAGECYHFEGEVYIDSIEIGIEEVTFSLTVNTIEELELIR